ncbi:tax1-binding protein 1 homolog B-like [Anopheles nili]|uniref:tax1-binding protein 1 homolog B-like n=1 Tax=Anopheles nili TaxID=185578 RepID=UPI00237A6FFC|nr:tax1-binding protein 1 homolog B-like [Anopheles nili]
MAVLDLLVSIEEVPRRQTFDKSTQPSPTHEKPDRWSKDRQLELKITVLEDRLKDTEERYQSKRLQCDTLSQVHRTLRDSYTTLQEESEMMQFDIRHLTRSADVLRSELQSARCDRDSAIELQKLLQTGLDVSHKDRKKLQDGSKKDLKTIQDLQRQCREMERIMMRKNPDSISALIVASKSPTGTPPGTDSTSSTCRVLEQRIAQLEADARKQDAKAQGILPDMQARFNSVEAKYETYIAHREVPRRQTFDKSTQPSPTHEKPDRWSKDRQLELKITVLEDRLKDTEERYQSKRLQCDTLSQVHRTLRDSYTTLQEESEMMQFDIRHLTRSADVLRSELQSAWCDRDSAIELQKLLQTGLDVSRKDRKKLQDGSKKDLKTIQDLQRQCREMERIMMRKNPGSISALIVASKSPTGTPPGTDSTSSTCRVLEQRIAQLEADARKQDAKAQGILPDMQARFNSVQAKYETYIAHRVSSLRSVIMIYMALNKMQLGCTS